MRKLIISEPTQLRAALLRATLNQIPPEKQDAWIDNLLGLDPLADDGPDLPTGCVPYIPCSIEILMQVIDESQLSSSDVFVDIGAGPGRVTALVHLLTGAAAIGIEVQAEHARNAKRMTGLLRLEHVAIVHADAVNVIGYIPIGTVFFLYCPFSNNRFERVIDELIYVATAQSIRICCVHLPRIKRNWLKVIAEPAPGVIVYESVKYVRTSTLPCKKADC